MRSQVNRPPRNSDMGRRVRADKSLERSRESVESRLLHSFERSKERHNMRTMRRRREEWEALRRSPKMLETSKLLLSRRNARTPAAGGGKPGVCAERKSVRKEGEVVKGRGKVNASLRASTPLNGSISYNKGLSSSPSYKRIPAIQFVESTEDFEIRNRCTFTPKLNKNSMALNSRRNSRKLEATKQSGKATESHRNPTTENAGKEQRASRGHILAVRNVKAGEGVIEQCEETTVGGSSDVFRISLIVIIC